MFSCSFISAQWKVSVDCLHSSQILVSRIFCWLYKKLFCNACNTQWIIHYHPFCKIIWLLSFMFIKHSTHFTAFNAYLDHHPLPVSITNIDAAFLIVSLKYSKWVMLEAKYKAGCFNETYGRQNLSRLIGIIVGCSFLLPILQGIRYC